MTKSFLHRFASYGLVLAAILNCSSGPRAAGGPAAVAGSGGPAVVGVTTNSLASAVAPDSFTVDMVTSKGTITMLIRRHWAPNGVDRLHELLRAKYYDGARIFRVEPGFVAQWGLAAIPAATAKYKARRIPDDPVRHSNLRGTITFARSGPNSRTAQLFINLIDNPRLDTDAGFGFPPIGEVIVGMERVDQFTAEYRGKTPRGIQDSISEQGESYLRRSFPNLDMITSMRIVKTWK